MYNDSKYRHLEWPGKTSMSDYYQQEAKSGFRSEGVTYIVHVVIMLNVLVFVAQLLLDIGFGDLQVIDTPGGTEIVRWLGFMPSAVMSGFVWMPLTYMFVHGSLMHLFGNMLMLFFFGPEVERVLGSRQFLRFYLLCGGLGVMANFATMITPGWNPNVLVVGASGATLGVLVAFAMIEPDRKIFLFPIPIPITTRFLVMFIIAMNLMSAAGGGSGTSFATHFGGMGVAYAYMKWRRQGPSGSVKTPPEKGVDEEKMADAIDNIFDFKNKNR
jgi:membrane associated rhomboid family serine protease